jgi:hypothetical protein
VPPIDCNRQLNLGGGGDRPNWAPNRSHRAINLTLRPEVIGRGHRITMLENLLRYVAGQRGATFRTLGEYATEWKANNPKDKWMAADPEATGINAITKLP